MESSSWNEILVAFFTALAVALLVSHLFWEWEYYQTKKKAKLEDTFLKK